MSKNINYQEVPIKIKPQFNGYSDYSEIIFFLPGEILPEIKFKNFFFQIMEKLQLIINLYILS